MIKIISKVITPKELHNIYKDKEFINTIKYYEIDDGF